MSRRMQHLNKLGELVQAMRTGASMKSRLHLLLTDELPPYLYKIWRWYMEQPNKCVTSQEVAQALGLTQYHTSTALKELWKLGLLDRASVENGQGFHYWFAEWESERWRAE